MKKIDLGQWVQILANLGVIAGIVFLGIELAQNNELLEFQRRLSALQLRQTQGDMYLSNAEVRQAVGRDLFGSEPTQEQQDQLLIFLALDKTIGTYEWQFLELPDNRARLSQQIEGTFVWSQYSRSVWEGLKVRLDPEFASFFEKASGLE